MTDAVGDVRTRLPHRYPFLMIDRIVAASAERAVARKSVSIDEPFFQGHFPAPLPAVMPGVLILEAMAQTAALLIDGGDARMGYLVAVREARFRRAVTPGDTLELTATPLRRRARLLQATVEAHVEGELAAAATLSLMMEGGDDAA
jgi:3-hydroxyacyl-[acyl-carrier-protein] dehydratase